MIGSNILYTSLIDMYSCVIVAFLIVQIADKQIEIEQYTELANTTAISLKDPDLSCTEAEDLRTNLVRSLVCNRAHYFSNCPSDLVQSIKSCSTLSPTSSVCM